MAGHSNLYDIFDSPSHTTLSDENGKGRDNHTMPASYSTTNTTAFDSMLEILPDSMDFSLFPATLSSHSNGEKAHSPKPSSVFPHLLSKQQDHPHSQLQLQNGFDSIFDHSANPTTATTNENVHGTNNKANGSGAQPIDIANQQNGEIAQLWDFNVDEFMMTPNNSNGSATITAPNSFNSELQFNPGSAPGVHLFPALGGSNQNGAFGMTMNNSLNGHGDHHQLLGIQIPHGAPNSAFYNHSESSSPRSNLQMTAKREETSGLHRPPLNGRRSSSQLNKALHAETGGIPLSSSATGNSVRKNSVAKQMASTSISNYKRGSTSSSTDLPKKPPLQCSNCKTLKTPLWRRDSHGNTLCNACGLFQKLHGTMRPLSLKSDVIKKRNNKKRAKKNQALADATSTTPNATANPNSASNVNSNGNGTSRPLAAKTGRPRKKTVPPANLPNSYGHAGDSLIDIHTPVSSNGPKLENGAFDAPVNVAYGLQHYQESLNSNNLMTHNKRLSTMVSSASKKSRRGSNSSNNSSSSRSSSRSVVPILPKPSPSAGNPSQFNLNLTTSNSAGNSAASSPRVIGPAFNSCSPMTSAQPSMFSSSTGRPGITIPGRKSSRNHSSSSSFMAASLQQLQNQHQQTTSNSQTSGSWTQNSATASPKTTRSPKAGFELFNSPVESTSGSNPTSKKSHTSLLSQQLQNSGQYSDNQSVESSAPSEGKNSLNINTFHLQQNLTSSLRKSSVTASPRNSYADSLLQHRGINKDDTNLNLRRQTSFGPRRTTSFRDQIVNTNSESGMQGNSTPATPLGLSTGNYEDSNSSGGSHNNIADELDWLKFGM